MARKRILPPPPKPTARRHAGRPSKFQQAFCLQAEMICRAGATDKDLAYFFSVGEATINRWKHDRNEFRESLKRGKLIADAEVAEALYKRATGYSHPAVKIMLQGDQPITVPYTKHYPPDPTSCIFWLKNRQPALWREKVVQHVGHSAGGPIEEKNENSPVALAALEVAMARLALLVEEPADPAEPTGALIELQP